ncbi:MAG: DUF2269 domain-containing protein [Actinomycetota bacterium]|nr:DUF2269 domain-containing protein [Actinomycetota bacterium]
MGVGSNLYDLVKVLHILAAIIGFGGTFIAGFYGAESTRREGREGLAVAETTMKVTSLAPTMAVYSVPILGILLILLSDDTWKFSDAWISLSFLLYIVILVLALTVQVPNIRRMIALRAGAEGVRTSEVEARARTSALLGGIQNVLWVVVLFLMVFKPGT